MSPAARWLVVFPLTAFLALIAELIYLSWPYYVGPDAWRGADLAGQIGGSVVTLAWNATVPVALAALLILTTKHLPRGMPAAGVTCVLFSGAVIAGMITVNVDDSSTSVLLLIFLPIYLFPPLLPFIGLTWLVHRLRARNSTRRDPR